MQFHCCGDCQVRGIDFHMYNNCYSPFCTALSAWTLEILSHLQDIVKTLFPSLDATDSNKASGTLWGCERYFKFLWNRIPTQDTRKCCCRAGQSTWRESPLCILILHRDCFNLGVKLLLTLLLNPKAWSWKCSYVNKNSIKWGTKDLNLHFDLGHFHRNYYCHLVKCCMCKQWKPFILYL